MRFFAKIKNKIKEQLAGFRLNLAGRGQNFIGRNRALLYLRTKLTLLTFYFYQIKQKLTVKQIKIFLIRKIKAILIFLKALAIAIKNEIIAEIKFVIRLIKHVFALFFDAVAPWKYRSEVLRATWLEAFLTFLLYQVWVVLLVVIVWLGSLPFGLTVAKRWIKARYFKAIDQIGNWVANASFSFVEYSPTEGFKTDFFPQPFWFYFYTYKPFTRKIDIKPTELKIFLSKNILLATSRPVNLKQINYGKTLVILLDTKHRVKKMPSNIQYAIHITQKQLITRAKGKEHTKNLQLLKPKFIAKYLHFKLTKKQVLSGIHFLRIKLNNYGLKKAYGLFAQLVYWVLVMQYRYILLFISIKILFMALIVLLSLIFSLTKPGILLLSSAALDFWLVIIGLLLNALLSIGLLHIGVWFKLLILLFNPLVYLGLLIAIAVALEYYRRI